MAACHAGVVVINTGQGRLATAASQVLTPRHPGSNAHAVAFHVLYDYADLRKLIKDGEPV